MTNARWPSTAKGTSAVGEEVVAAGERERRLSTRIVVSVDEPDLVGMAVLLQLHGAVEEDLERQR